MSTPESNTSSADIGPDVSGTMPQNTATSAAQAQPARFASAMSTVTMSKAQGLPPPPESLKVHEPLNLATARQGGEVPVTEHFLRSNGVDEEVDNHDSGIEASDDDNEEDKEMRDVGNDKQKKTLTKKQKETLLIDIIQATGPDSLISIIMKTLPKGTSMSLNQLKEEFNPDKCPQDREAAAIAIKIIDDTIASGKPADWEYHRTPEQDAQYPKLQPFHQEAYARATPHLQTLCRLDNRALEAQFREQIRAINDSISEQNRQAKMHWQDRQININAILGHWMSIAESNDPKTTEQLKKSLSRLCKLSDYPKEWKTIFPQPGTAQPAQPAPAQPAPAQPAPAQPAPAQPAPAQPAPAQPAPAQPALAQAVPEPAQSVHPKSNREPLSGSRRVISLAPRLSRRAIEPGKTSTGEKIHFIQELGANRARFVVEGPDRTVRLVESAAAGGFIALDGAREAKVPKTVQKEADITQIKNYVRRGGQYGLTFVAVGEWDPTQKRLPFIVVGFYHNVPEQAVGISRSNLGKILSPREGERLIVEGILGHQNASLSLRDALIAELGLPVDPTGFALQHPGVVHPQQQQQPPFNGQHYVDNIQTYPALQQPYQIPLDSQPLQHPPQQPYQQPQSQQMAHFKPQQPHQQIYGAISGLQTYQQPNIQQMTPFYPQQPYHQPNFHQTASFHPLNQSMVFGPTGFQPMVQSSTHTNSDGEEEY